MPYFGFKAKQSNFYTVNHQDCTVPNFDSFATQFQTDFCQSSFNGAGETKLCVQNMAPVAEVMPSILR